MIFQTTCLKNREFPHSVWQLASTTNAHKFGKFGPIGMRKRGSWADQEVPPKVAVTQNHQTGKVLYKTDSSKKCNRCNIRKILQHLTQSMCWDIGKCLLSWAPQMWDRSLFRRLPWETGRPSQLHSKIWSAQHLQSFLRYRTRSCIGRLPSKQAAKAYKYQMLSN